ncbi:MAG: hypothetical protein ABII02_02270 [Candidatus Magasanikbacteria bacterium]
MKTSKFLEEIKALENKLRQKASDETGRLGFSALVQQLANLNQLDDQIVNDLKELWVLRNKIYSSPTAEVEISNEAQNLLASLISNPKLQ